MKEKKVFDVDMQNNEFLRRLIQGLNHDCNELRSNNIDILRYRPSFLARIKKQLKDKIFIIAKRKGLLHRYFKVVGAYKHLRKILKNINGLDSLYNLLEDGYSRSLLIEILKFRILGPRHVRLPLNTQEYWEIRENIDKNYLTEKETIKLKSWPYYLNRYKLERQNGFIELHFNALGIAEIFILEHYAYTGGGRNVQAQPGDIVIDCGGFLGETALYFADKVGSDGKVFCFECDKDNLEILNLNIDLNQNISNRIKVLPNALWDKSGVVVSYYASGPGTKISENHNKKAPQVFTMSIDDFVNEAYIKKVDYIKMDIEGSELRALKGAEKTICSFKPKLAISLYHRENDLFQIPDYLHNLGLQYEYFLDHYSIHLEETVLFASPKYK